MRHEAARRSTRTLGLMNQRIVKTSNASRLKLLATWCLAFMALAIASYFKPWVQDRVFSTRPEDVILVNGIFGTFFLLGACVGVYVTLTGRRIVRLGQYPLPDKWVIRDTPVVVGPVATRRGYVLMVSGVFVFFFVAIKTGLAQ